MLDLFDLALGNQGALQVRYQDLRSRMNDAEFEQLSRFAGQVQQHARVSTNMRKHPS